MARLGGKKDLLAKMLYRFGLFRLLSFGGNQRCIVINYHRIKKCNNHATLFDNEVFGPDQQEFEQQIQWLKKNSDVLSEDDLISVVREQYKPSGRSIVITFDDGYVDNYSLAYPVLKQHCVPAIFFISTQSIEERCLGWWDNIAYILKSTAKKEVIFEGKCLQPKYNFQEAMKTVLHFVDQNKKDVFDLLDTLSVACEVNSPDINIQGGELMTWDQLEEVSNNGISIGAHTHSHKILSSLDLTQQKKEIEKAKKIIEQRLSKPVRSMSYPVGNYHHFTDATKKIVADAGFDLSFSFLTGLNKYGDIDPMDVKRISVSSYFPRFVGTIEIPYLFCDSF